MTETLIALTPMTSALSRWAGERLPGDGKLAVSHLAEGHSNLTFVLSREGSEQSWILRRPPNGPLLPSAHDVLREARVLTALAGQGVRVPTVVGLDDGDLLGVPFYVMEKIPGAVVRHELPRWLPDEPSRHVLGLDLVDTLAELHAVDPEVLVQAGLGRRGGYLGRQLRRWSSQHDLLDADARPLPDYERVRSWLAERLPELDSTARVTVVHGDYKLDNVLIDPVSRTVLALLDWEMATVGDPLSDLGYFLAMTPSPDIPPVMEALTGRVTAHAGFPRRDEVLQRYAFLTGHDLTHLKVYEVLALWKMGTLLEMSYHRYLAGTTDDLLFPELEWGVPAIYARAASLMD